MVGTCAGSQTFGTDCIMPLEYAHLTQTRIVCILSTHSILHSYDEVKKKLKITPRTFSPGHLRKLSSSTETQKGEKQTLEIARNFPL